MITERAWPAKAMYFLIAAALAISLIIVAAPAQKASAQNGDVAAEWERVETPTTDDWVLSPRSYIVDSNVAAEGEVAYTIQEKWHDVHEFVLLKSDDYAATWDDITDALVSEAEDELFDEPEDLIEELVLVATDWEDPDFVAVALMWYDYDGGVLPYYYLHVFISTDGGDTFIDTGEVEDTVFFDVHNAGSEVVSDLVVTPEAGGEREIAISGMEDQGFAALFRCTVTGDAPGAWYDATDYDGWDDEGAFTSVWALDLGVSPSWGIDKTILVTTISPAAIFYDVYLQCGSWGTSEGWNEDSTLGIEAVMILDDENIPMWLPMWDARAIAGMTLPEDYNSKNTNERLLWVWANYYDMATGGTPMCDIMRVDDDSADPVGPMGQIEDGELFLTNISYQGTIAEGKAIAGVLGDGMDDFAECCEGVQVYRNDGIRMMDICCERWHDACKPPTGRAGMAVHYVGDDKAYAVTIGEFEPYDESAVSVTFDDGDTWNQLSLIDTDIEYISDVAVSPDCNKTFLATVNYRGCSCDSVWLHAETLHEAEEYNGQWLRTWCGHLIGWNNQASTDTHTDFPFVSRRSLLRLAQDETDGETVFLLDRMTGDVYKSGLESLACWDPIGSTELDDIVDFVAQDADTLFALDYYGDVAMFDDDEWQEAVDSEVGLGWTIAVWGDHILVGGAEGDVSYSDDGGETFTALEDVTDYDSAHVTLAFDSYFDQNDTIYAALANAQEDNGIYILVIDGETDEWTKLAAKPFNYTGLVLDRADGNPMTSPETGGVLYASYRMWDDVDNCDPCCGNDELPDKDYCWQSGVARCLEPIVEICCGTGEAEWNYLTWDLCWHPEENGNGNGDHCADFRMPPQALKICGCLTPDSNTHLFVIDGDSHYDMDEGLEHTVWTFEDCYSKKGVEVTGPDDGAVIDSFVCELCANEPFKVSWDRLCDACCYEFQFAMDEDFTDLYDPYYDGYFEMDGECYNPDWYCPDVPTEPSRWMESMFLSESTYYWRVRAVEAETCQDIYSWWSEPRSFTVAPTASAGAINLVSPEPGDTGVSIDGLGFSWTMIADADNFDWVLDNNSDFSSPVDSGTGLTDTAYGTTSTLDYDATYYWQVTAYRNGSEIGKSAVGTFRTMLEAEEPYVPPEAGTPFWVWVVIAIGAVLVIVVIVLIFRTRRV